MLDMCWDLKICVGTHTTVFPTRGANSGNVHPKCLGWGKNTKALPVFRITESKSVVGRPNTFQNWCGCCARQLVLVAQLPTAAKEENEARKDWCVATGSGLPETEMNLK